MAAWKQLGVALVAVLTLLGPGAGRTCPLTPSTTWVLTRDAERIVVGRVVRTWRVDSVPEDFATPGETEDDRQLREVLRELAPRERVEVEVLEVWKGAPVKTLTVVSDAPWDQLSSVQERAGTEHTLLLFLTRVGDVWETAGYLSEQQLEDADVAAWRDLVARAVALQASPDVQRESPLDWNVLAALNPATRQEGLDALIADPRLWEDTGILSPVPVAHPLSPVAQRRIATSFVARPGGPVLQVLLALQGHQDPKVDAVALQLLEEGRQHWDLDPYMLGEPQDAMDLLSVRMGVSGPGTERCKQGAAQAEVEAARADDEAAYGRCVHARWERLRALHAEQAR